jgi:hypothetical protein
MAFFLTFAAVRRIMKLAWPPVLGALSRAELSPVLLILRAGISSFDAFAAFRK